MQKWLTRPVAAIRVDPGQRTEGGENRGGWEKAGSPRIGYYRAADADQAPPVSTPAATAKRSFPSVEPVGSFAFPAIEHATLKNGIPVTFAPRSAVPKVTVTVRYDAAYASAAAAARRQHSITAALLPRDPQNTNPLSIAERHPAP